MGYCIFQNEEQSNFQIKAENKNKALVAIKSLVGKGRREDSSGRHYSWVDDENYKNSLTLENALKAWRWKSKNDNDENIIGLIFTGEKYGDDLILFNTIAPFVEDNSCIKMQGEDGKLFEWYFLNDVCEELEY